MLVLRWTPVLLGMHTMVVETECVAKVGHRGWTVWWVMASTVETEVVTSLVSEELLVLNMELLIGVIKSNAWVVALWEVDTGLKTLINALFPHLFLEIVIVLLKVYYDKCDIILAVVVGATLISDKLRNLVQALSFLSQHVDHLSNLLLSVDKVETVCWQD